LRLRSFFLLLTKEFRELFASRAFWIMLLIAGLLVGHAFITAVRLYAEMSGVGGGPAALPQGLTRSTASLFRRGAHTIWRRRCCFLSLPSA
jgi:hypothetical protein